MSWKAVEASQALPAGSLPTAYVAYVEPCPHHTHTHTRGTKVPRTVAQDLKVKHQFKVKKLTILRSQLRHTKSQKALTRGAKCLKPAVLCLKREKSHSFQIFFTGTFRQNVHSFTTMQNDTQKTQHVVEGVPLSRNCSWFQKLLLNPS